MRLKYIHYHYVKYNKGKGYICGHIEALHAQPPAADQYTDVIIQNIMMKTGCAGIIGTVSRIDADLNRSPDGKNDEGIKEYRMVIKDIIRSLGILDLSNNTLSKPYLHLSIHGMKDAHYGPLALEIGTLHGKSCSPEIKEWFVECVTKKSKELIPEIEIVFDEKFVGNSSIGYHRWGDGNSYKGYRENFHTFQIEISRTLRKKYGTEMSDLFAHVIYDFQSRFVDHS